MSKLNVMEIVSVYQAWRSIKDRCLNKKSHAYADYGGRGIRICDRWMDFQVFLDDVGPRAEGMSFDRIDNDGNYEPSNCRWADKKTQASNKRNNVWIVAYGKRMTTAQWSRETGLNHTTIRRRFFDLGWTGEESVDPRKHCGGYRHGVRRDAA